MGYDGEDCSLKLCPKTYDPDSLKVNLKRRSVRLTTGLSSGKFFGRYDFTFASSSVTFQANANQFNGGACTEALKALKSATNVTCELESANAITQTGSYIITLNSYPVNPPYENNFFKHNGNPQLSAFSCNVSNVDPEDAIDPYCVVDDVNVDEVFSLVSFLKI